MKSGRERKLGLSEGALKILLINPSQEKVYGRKMMPAYPPLGLLYVGAVAERDGHKVRLVDIDTERIDDAGFAASFRGFDPDVVGLTCTTPTFSNALWWARRCKQLKKKVTVVMGGVHATSVPREVIGEKPIDIVVVGEGEGTARELFGALARKGNLRKVRGIVFKKNGRVIENERRPLIDDLDAIPFPDRRLLVCPGAFVPPDALHLPAVSLMTSRGCPGSCTFCCAKNVFTQRFRVRSVPNMLAEIEGLVRNGVREIHIIDDAFTINKRRVLDFCREVRNCRINVSFQLINGIRADFADREVLKALRSIGVTTVGYGVETGNVEVLRRTKKGIPLAVTRKAFRVSKELGFTTWAFLIFGLPGETEESARQTIEFTKELDPDFAKFLILKPYPGSEVFAELQQGNLLLSANYDEYGVYTSPVHRLPEFAPERMVYWQKRALWEFYFRPRKVISHLARIRSFTQLRLLVNDVLFGVAMMLKGKKIDN